MFQLNRIKAAGNEVTYFVVATHKADSKQLFVVYDETVGYTLSTMTDLSGEVQTVDMVYMWGCFYFIW